MDEKTLPQEEGLAVGKLAGIFDKRTTSYKYLFFKAILDSVKEGEKKVLLNNLLLKSISNALYGIHFYKLSLGKQDQMNKWIEQIDEAMDGKLLVSDMLYTKIYKKLQEMDFYRLENIIKELSLYVPFRLLTPWFYDELRGKKDAEKNKMIEKLSHLEEFSSLYKIVNEQGQCYIELDKKWFRYLKTNESIVLGWWKNHYIGYLQKHNPTVLSIPTKIEPPQTRKMEEIKKLFTNYFENKKPQCIYSGELVGDIIHHDHFFPWSFLGSDPLYNFVPTIQSINSSKSNLIPHKKYLPKAAIFQFEFFSFLREKKNRKIEPFLNDLRIEDRCQKDEFVLSFENYYKPLYISAKNQGFGVWTFKNKE